MANPRVTMSDIIRSYPAARPHTLYLVEKLVREINNEAHNRHRQSGGDTVVFKIYGETIQLYRDSSTKHRRPWLYDDAALKAFDRIIDRSVHDIPKGYLAMDNARIAVEFSASMEGASKKVTTARFATLWDRLTAKAAAEFKEQHGQTIAAYAKSITGLGKKPSNWPNSNAVTIEDNGHPVTFFYLTWSVGDKGIWYVNEESIPALKAIYAVRPKFMDVKEMAVSLGIHGTTGQPQSKTKRDSAVVANYRDLEALFRELRAAADRLSPSHDPDEVEVTLDGRTFELGWASARRKWLVSAASESTIKEAFGLRPGISVAGSPKDAWTSAVNKGSLWPFDLSGSYAEAVTSKKTPPRQR